MLRVASSIGPSPLIAAENSERIAVFVCFWHSTDLPILHNHVRLAWQTGNHLNLLSISADGPNSDIGPTGARSEPR